MTDLVVSGDCAPPLASPSLIAGESAAAYDDFFARIQGALRPADVLEEIWVRDVADLAWEVFRLRRLKAQLMRASAYEGMQQVLKPLMGNEDYPGIAKQWSAGDAAAVAKADAALAAAGLTVDAVMAQTLSLRINIVERMERIMMAAEARRDAALRQIEERRASLAERLRGALREAEDAEFTVIAPAQAEAAA